jgi:6-phosphogluconolactonase
MPGSNAFSSPSSPRRRLLLRRPSPSSSLLAPLHAAPAKRVHILATENDVTKAIHTIVESSATSAIQSRGRFTLAIPGGSVLKILSTLAPGGDWPNYTTIIFVNHKCVPIDDVTSAIEAQARAKFIDTNTVGYIIRWK